MSLDEQRRALIPHAACEHFATLLEAESVAGDAGLLTRWWQTWNALGDPEDTPLSW